MTPIEERNYMNPIIYRRPYLIIRITLSLNLQILLVWLIRQPHQDSLQFNLAIMALALLASWLLTITPGYLKRWTMILMWPLSVWPKLAFVAILLHLAGWEGLFEAIQKLATAPL
jgi:hypothetical protein